VFSNINAAGNAIPARLADYYCSGVSGKEEASPPCLAHKDFHESATPERKRFRVNRNPSGEMLIVNGSPSISISRRMVFSSLVGMRLLVIHAGTGTVRWRSSSAAEHVVDEPISLLLTNDCLTDHSGSSQHLMGRLKDPLEMRRISLCQRQLLA